MRADFRSPFPEWSEGVFFFFRIGDLVALEDIYGPGEVISGVETALSRVEASAFVPLVEHGLKAEVDGKMQPAGMPEDIFAHMADQGITIETFKERVMDAFMMQTQGKTYAEAVEEARKLQDEMMARVSKKMEADDPSDPFAVSEASSDPSSSDTGPD